MQLGYKSQRIAGANELHPAARTVRKSHAGVELRRVGDGVGPPAEIGKLKPSLRGRTGYAPSAAAALWKKRSRLLRNLRIFAT